MTKLDWFKAAEPDPGRVIQVGDDVLMSDSEAKNFRKRIADRSKAAAPKPPPRGTFAMAAKGLDVSKLSLRVRISVVKRSGKSDANSFIHSTAIMALRHAQTYGDCSHALALVLAMPPGSRRADLSKWFGKFGPLSINVVKSKAQFRSRESKQYNEFDIETASRVSFVQV